MAAAGPSPRLVRAGSVARALVPLAIIGFLLTSGTADLYGQIGAKTQQLNGVNGRISSTKTHLQQLLDQQHALQAQIGQLNARLTRVAAQISQETTKLHALGAQIDAAKAQLAQKEVELQQHVVALGARMRSMYKTGEMSPFELVFSAIDFNDLINRVFFFGDIVRNERQQVEQLRQERADIEAIKQDVDRKYAQQAQVVQAIKNQQTQLQQARDQRAGAEAQIQAIAAEFQRQLQEMEAQRAAVQAQLRQLIQESLRAGSTGHFIWPLQGIITQGFGCTPYPFEVYDPNCATLHFHSGIDIAAPYGAPVHAADGGIVHNFATNCGGYLCGYGQYVIMVHANGFATLYGHLSAYNVADGTQVGQGAVIGYEGSTGNSTGAHCHFEVDLNGAPVNPLAYLP